MGHWYHDLIAERHRLPLLLCFLAFIVTFVVTRLITRTIRAGKGPFKDNVTAGGTHIHHAVPGMILLMTGAFVAVGTSARPYIEIAGILVGVGTSLVMDEFALILHLSDVYWAAEGRLSVELVSLTVACMGMILVGVNPLDLTDTTTGRITAASVLSGLLVHLIGVGVSVWKGKYELAVLGVFVPLLGIVCAVRLARPDSRWAQRFYRNPRKIARATARAARYDRRFGRFTNVLGGFIASPAVLAADEEHEQAQRAAAREVARERRRHSLTGASTPATTVATSDESAGAAPSDEARPERSTDGQRAR